MRERKREYELMIIISPLQSSEEAVAGIIDRVRQSIVHAGGEVTAVDHSPPWGRRKLAYPIREYAGGEASRRNFTEGFYVLIAFTLAAAKVTDVERTIKLTDVIIRHLITVVERRKQPGSTRMAVDIDIGAVDEEEDEELVEDDNE